MQSAAENQVSKDNRVRELLVVADNHRRALRIVTPRKQNAFETYKQVLALDPNSSEAKQGVAQLIRIEERLARSAYRKGLLQASLQRIDAGLSIDAKDPALLALRQQVEDQIRADQRAQQPPPPKVVRERPTKPATNGSSPTAKPLTPTHPGKSTSEAPAPTASPTYAPTEGSATTAKPAPRTQPAEAVDAPQPPAGTKSEEAPARIRTFPSY